jgi:hypothetical protein
VALLISDFWETEMGLGFQLFLFISVRNERTKTPNPPWSIPLNQESMEKGHSQRGGHLTSLATAFATDSRQKTTLFACQVEIFDEHCKINSFHSFYNLGRPHEGKDLFAFLVLTSFAEIGAALGICDFGERDAL